MTASRSAAAMKARCLAVLGLYAGFVSAGELSCTALIREQSQGNDLYFADEAGTLLEKLANDGRAKGSASLSPRGDKASFSYDGVNTEIEIVSRDGVARTVVLDQSVDRLDAPLYATHWDSDALVMVQFYGHANSLFQWVGVGKTRVPSNVPNGATDSVLRMATGCASAPQGRHIACIQGDWISIDDGAGVSIDPFDEGRSLGTFDAIEGATMPVPGYDAASFTVVKVQPDGTSYRAGLGEYQPEIYMPDNQVGLVERIGASAWGEFRVVSHRVRSATSEGGATIAVRVLDVEELPELAGLAWTEDGSRLAFTRIKPGAASELFIVKQDGAGRWRISKRLVLGADDAGGRLKFIDASTIYARGVGAGGAVFAIKGDHLEKIKTLPNYFESRGAHASRLLSVEDWSCVRR